jgi:hypothetical protein
MRPGVFNKLLPRKTWKRVALVLLLGAVAWAVHMTSPRAVAPRVSAYVARPMLMQHSRDEYAQELFYYLVPASPAQVRAALQAKLDGEGYAWADDSAPLDRLSSYWVNTTVRHRPEIRRALLDAHGVTSTPVLEEALAKGVVTPDEKAAFAAALAGQGEFDDDTVKQVPFFAQRIQRWRFTRTRGDLIRYDDDGGLMDVSSVFDRGPMTLVWFHGARTARYYRPHLLSCMTGVACFPVPSVEVRNDAVMYVDAALDRDIHEVAGRFHALDAASTEGLLSDFVRSGAGDDVVPPLRDAAGAPAVALAAHDLPADEADLRRYDNNSWRLLALPDGSVLAAGSQSRRYVLNDDKLVLRDEPLVVGAEGGVRMDAQGAVWGFSRQEADDDLGLVRWTPGQPAAKPVPVPYAMEDWTLIPGHGVGLREGDGKLHVLDIRTGQWSHAAWNDALRGKVSDSLEQVMPSASSGVPIHFHDGLLWLGDRDLYGISPLTGKVAAAAKLTKHSHLLTSVFFGSRDAGWAIALTNAPSGSTVYRLFDLATGEPRADLLAGSANYPVGVARTARGRLLATASSSENVPVTVFDTRTGQPLVNLTPPAGYAASAVAFSWKGDGLWVYLEEAGADSHRKLAWWPVPEAYRDAAAGEAVPDQLRCDRRLDACEL